MSPIQTEHRKINTRRELKELARKLKVGPDWHEPDGVGVDAIVKGHHLDNAGFELLGGAHYERTVYIKQNGQVVAKVNLATLLAFACGYNG